MRGIRVAVVVVSLASLVTLGVATESAARSVVTVGVPPAEQPFVASFSPPSGPVGTVVTVRGLDLQVVTAVTFDGGATAPAEDVGPSSFVVTVPAGARTGRFTLAPGPSVSPRRFRVTR